MKRILKYLLTIIIVLTIMTSLSILEKTIPNTKSRINIIKSTTYFQDYYKKQIKSTKPNLHQVDMTNELNQISIIYLENNKDYYTEMIEMNYDSKAQEKIRHFKSINDYSVNKEYSRYWHGNLVILKPLLSFFTIKTIYKIHLVIFLIIFCVLLFKLLKHSILLTIAFILGAISINMFNVTNCTNLINIFYLAMITSIIIIHKYEKDQNINILFLIIGMLSSYFDLITCETITLTLPLFIYIFLHFKDKKQISIKTIIIPILLWLLGFTISYLFKWLLVVIHYHGHFIDKVFDPLKLELFKESKNITNTIKIAFKSLLPYNINFIYIFVAVSLFISIINIIKLKKNRINYLFLIIISLIPFLRYLVLSYHSNLNNYFTYKAFLPFIMFLITSDILYIINLIKKED